MSTINITIAGDVIFNSGCCANAPTSRGASEDLLLALPEIETSKSMTFFSGVKTLMYGGAGIYLGVLTGSALFVAIGGCSGLIYGLFTAKYNEVKVEVNDSDCMSDAEYAELNSQNNNAHTNKSVPKIEQGKPKMIENVPKDELKDAMKALESKLESIKGNTESLESKMSTIENIQRNYKAIEDTWNKREQLEYSKIQDAEVV